MDDVLEINVTSEGVRSQLATDTGSYQFLKDQQGTVSAISDSSGNLIQKYVYSAFGELLGIQDANASDITSQPALRTPYAYTGRELDPESGYYYYRARYYDSQIGRFLQKDPEPGRTSLPSTITNGYIYVSNNPATYTDGTGKFAFLLPVLAFIIDLAVTAAVAGAITGVVTGVIFGLASMNEGRGFLSGFASGFSSGFINGAVQGAFSFAGGAVMAALKIGSVASSVLVGAAQGAFNAYLGSQGGGGLAGGLLGFTSGFIGGGLGAPAGQAAYKSAMKGIGPSLNAVKGAVLDALISPQVPNITDFLEGAAAAEAARLSSPRCNQMNVLCQQLDTI